MTNAEYLSQQSKAICILCACTEEEHKCASYAYFDKDHNLLDVCHPDYFAGHSGPVAAIPLPWQGTQEELDAAIDEDLG